jgi:cytochrome c553
MKRIFKVVAIIITVVTLAIAGILSYVKFALPNASKVEDIKIEATPERLERGKYLATNVMSCLDCHSKRDYSRFGAPTIPSSLGQGGELFGVEIGFPGNFFAPNITPSHLKDWTDGEIFRAITEGVSKDGHALFPVMPYLHYGTSDKEDIYSVIAYIRTLAPIENATPPSSPEFPVNFLINTMPKAPVFQAVPPKDDIIKYGAYLTNAAACMDCHTQQVKGTYQMDKYMAGGFIFKGLHGEVVQSANITPDPTTGIGKWTADSFVARFKLYSDTSKFKDQPVKPGEFNSPMPWRYYTSLKEEDLKAIFAYLQTVKPIQNEVVKFQPAAQ